MGDIPPCATVYVNNLNEKIKKDELRKSLSAIFTQFGKIIDINCAKTYTLRGQAWVVFEDVAAATNAVKQLNEFPFYDKPMRVSYATSKSDASAKRDGTFDSAKRDPLIRQKRKAESQVSEKKSQAAKKEAGEQKNAVAAANDAPPNEILFVEGLPGKRAATSSFGVLVRRGFKSRTSPTFFFLNNPTPRRCRPMITSHNR
jgi:RNA recognition motif-containing protein